MADVTDRQDADRVIPSWEDRAVRAASGMVGGPWGRHGMVGRAFFWTPLRVCLALTTFTLALGWLQKSPCKSGAWMANLQYTHMCYSDIIPLYYTEQLNEGAIPYRDHAVEYPVLTGFFMYVARSLSALYDTIARNGAAPKVGEVESYFDATALLLAISALVTTWAVYHLVGRRTWDTALVALSPVLLVHAFTNWDLFAVALGSAGLLAWSRKAPVWAGLFIGLGGAAKLYPLFFLWPLLVLCVRARKLQQFWECLLAAAITWLVVNVPVWFLWPDSWLKFFTLNQQRPADPDSLWHLLETRLGEQFGNGGTPSTLNLITVALFGLICLAVGALALLARRRPRLPQLLFLVVAGFLLVNKVWSPQYTLWLVPLAVLARPSWKAILAWQLTEAFLWFPRMYWYLGTANKGLDEHWFQLAVLIRDGAVLWLAALIVYDVLRPEHDVVRRSGMDDPAGGVLDGAPDGAALGSGEDVAPSEHPPAGLAEEVERAAAPTEVAVLEQPPPASEEEKAD